MVLSPKKTVLKTYLRRRSVGGCPNGAADSRRQDEVAMNCERSDGLRQEPEVAVVDIARSPPRVQEPANRKRGGLEASELRIRWAVKKQRSAIAGGSGRGSAIADVNGVAAVSPSSLIVQETAGILVGPEIICKKDQCSAGRKDEKLRPCTFTFAVPEPALHGVRPDSEVLGVQLRLRRRVQPARHCQRQNGEEVRCPTKKRYPDIVVVSPSGKVSMAGPSIPLIRAKSTARQCPKSKKHYDCKTAKQPFTSLSSWLRCLGVTNVPTVLTKVLTPSDCECGQSRLQLQPSIVTQSPLMNMITPYEHRVVCREDTWDGIPMQCLDQHGRSYYMNFKFIASVGAYRLIGGWPTFLEDNDVCSGDLLELGAFRFEGQLVLTLLISRAKEGQTREDTEAAESSKEVQIAMETEESEAAAEEQTSEQSEGAEKWTGEEMEVAAIMMELSESKN